MCPCGCQAVERKRRQSTTCKLKHGNTNVDWTLGATFACCPTCLQHSTCHESFVSEIKMFREKPQKDLPEQRQRWPRKRPSVRTLDDVCTSPWPFLSPSTPCTTRPALHHYSCGRKVAAALPITKVLRRRKTRQGADKEQLRQTRQRQGMCTGKTHKARASLAMAADQEPVQRCSIYLSEAKRNKGR